MESFKGKTNVVCADQEVICVNISTVIVGFFAGVVSKTTSEKRNPANNCKTPRREVQNFSIFGVLCVIMHFNVFFVFCS